MRELFTNMVVQNRINPCWIFSGAILDQDKSTILTGYEYLNGDV